MRILFTLTDGSFAVDMNDGAAARDFARLLPLTVTLSDFHGIEKVADLPHKLDTEGSPAGASASRGDLTYYAPWGNLAFFYRDFGYAAGLVPLGAVVGDAAVLDGIADGDEATVTLLT